MPQHQAHNEAAIETREDALEALRKAWPSFVAECRSVLGSELHYQALLYHCLRAHGRVPPRQLGMNVKIWITEVISPHFRNFGEKKRPEYRGGFEPIPDVVIFEPEIDGDWRRRNHENTLRHMLLAIEVKASERHLGRLRPGEIVDDILKLEALQIEALHRGGSDMVPAVVTIDTAPEANERMRPEARLRLSRSVHRAHSPFSHLLRSRAVLSVRERAASGTTAA
jgi:hypothetical protein